MSIVVQKFGGTSLADTQRIERCAKIAIEAKNAGHDVVVVVSAMGDLTDDLIGLARALNPMADRRQMDLLISSGEQISTALMTMTLRRLGAPAVGVTGRRLGIRTDDNFGDASIEAVDTSEIRAELAAGHIVVAAGYQGTTGAGEIATLGRGGSDATAIALAAGLGVDDERGACEIYTDVDGVYSADPRLVPEARRIRTVSYESMLEMAAAGAQVVQSRAVALGRTHDVPIHVRSSSAPDEGTLVTHARRVSDVRQVVSCAMRPHLTRFSLRGEGDAIGLHELLLTVMDQLGAHAEDIAQTQSGAASELSFTVADTDAARIAEHLEARGEAVQSVHMHSRLSRVAAVGSGLGRLGKVAATMLRAMRDSGIAVHAMTTSELSVCCCVDDELGPGALRAVHDAFGLG